MSEREELERKVWTELRDKKAQYIERFGTKIDTISEAIRQLKTSHKVRRETIGAIYKLISDDNDFLESIAGEAICELLTYESHWINEQ